MNNLESIFKTGYSVNAGVLSANDRSMSIIYDDVYWQKFVNYNKNKEKRRYIQKIREDLVEKYCGNGSILDYGCGDCYFIFSNNNKNIIGYDVIPQSVALLVEAGKFFKHLSMSMSMFKGICLWDVLEHLPEPRNILDAIPSGAYVFISIPIFEDFGKIEQSTHWRPFEHYWYFTEQGLIGFMEGYSLMEVNEDETKAGRVGIKTFVFRKE